MSRGASHEDNVSGLLSEVADLAARALEAAGIPPEVARSAGVHVADGIAAEYGGVTLYIPQNAAAKTAARDAAISNALNDSDAVCVGRQFGISTTAVYRAARRHQARRNGRNER